MADGYEAALESLGSSLASDGYMLAIRQPSEATDGVTITVTAGPDACEECLVPMPIFTAILADRLTESGLSSPVTVVYPDGSRSLLAVGYQVG